MCLCLSFHVRIPQCNKVPRLILFHAVLYLLKIFSSEVYTTPRYTISLSLLKKKKGGLSKSESRVFSRPQARNQHLYKCYNV